MKLRKYFYLLSLILVFFGATSFLIFKPDIGIDLSGGQILEVKTNLNVEEIVKKLNLKAVIYQNDNIKLIKAKNNLNLLWQEIKKNDEKAEQLRFEEISPSLSSELKKSSITAIILVILAIALYVAFSFRKLKGTLPIRIFALVVILTLFHDVIASIGPYVIFSKILGFDIDVKFIIALLIIAGYSVSDTIVIFDRLRENILKFNKINQELFQKSLNEVLSRSILTSLSTILLILPISFLVPNLKAFLYALQIGFVIGTYSSICLAAPLVYDLRKK